MVSPAARRDPESAETGPGIAEADAPRTDGRRQTIDDGRRGRAQRAMLERRYEQIERFVRGVGRRAFGSGRQRGLA